MVIVVSKTLECRAAAPGAVPVRSSGHGSFGTPAASETQGRGAVAF